MEEIIQDLSNEILREAYTEILDCTIIGKLKQDGIVETTYQQICNKYNYSNENLCDGDVKMMMLLEITRRTIEYL